MAGILEQRQAALREKQTAGNPTRATLVPVATFAERHFTVAEIAGMWNLGPDSVRRIFGREPGVLVLAGNNSTRRKARYTTLRIPESVLERVHRRLCTVGGR
jgi:hypothetical protein